MSRHPQYFKGHLFARAASAAGFQIRCQFCAVMLSYETATVDHEPSLALGGRPRQAVLSCYECNQRRGQETNAAVNRRRKAKGNGQHKRRKKRKPK